MTSNDITSFVLRLTLDRRLDREIETAKEDVSITGNIFFEDNSEYSTIEQSLYLLPFGLIHLNTKLV